jgi:hypothetical protein
VEVHHELGGMAVEAPQLRRRDGAVDRVAQQLVPEVVVALVDVVEWVEDRGVHELLDRRLELAQRSIGQTG